MYDKCIVNVTSRMGRVSRNPSQVLLLCLIDVTSRMGRVSRNILNFEQFLQGIPSRPAWGV